jgi:hypothetical protein
MKRYLDVLVPAVLGLILGLWMGSIAILLLTYLLSLLMRYLPFDYPFEIAYVGTEILIFFFLLWISGGIDSTRVKRYVWSTFAGATAGSFLIIWSLNHSPFAD